MNNLTPAPDYAAPERASRNLYNKEKEMLKFDEAAVQLAALTGAFNALVAELNAVRASRTSKSKSTGSDD